ncbi:ABC-type transport auxiliary lipoprotein family protein [Hydrogenimonas sp.]
MKIYWIGAAAAMLLLGGCSVKKVPPTHYYLLHPSTPSLQQAVKEPKFGSLKLAFTHPSKISESTAIYYLDDRFRQQPYSYSRWYDTVDTMFENKLLRALERSGIAENIATNASAASTRMVLELAILDCVQDYSGKAPSKGRIAILASLIERKDGTTVATKLFEADADAPTQNAEGGVAALNEAADRIVAEMIRWLKNVETKSVPQKLKGARNAR